MTVSVTVTPTGSAPSCGASPYTIVARHGKPGFTRVYRKPRFRVASTRGVRNRLLRALGEGKLRIPPTNYTAGRAA